MMSGKAPYIRTEKLRRSQRVPIFEHNNIIYGTIETRPIQTASGGRAMLQLHVGLCSFSSCFLPSLPPSLSLSFPPPPAPVSVTNLALSFACLKQGQDLTLRCNIRGFPRPTVTFSFGGTPITPGEGIYNGYIERTFYDEVSWKSSYITSYQSRGQVPC